LPGKIEGIETLLGALTRCQRTPGQEAEYIGSLRYSAHVSTSGSSGARNTKRSVSMNGADTGTMLNLQKCEYAPSSLVLTLFVLADPDFDTA
jgi:hypothetical protein